MRLQSLAIMIHVMPEKALAMAGRLGRVRADQAREVRNAADLVELRTIVEQVVVDRVRQAEVRDVRNLAERAGEMRNVRISVRPRRKAQPELAEYHPTREKLVGQRPSRLAHTQ
jgi:hypothetical protein